MARPDPEILKRLRARIWALERTAPAASEALSLAAAIDDALPWAGCRSPVCMRWWPPMPPAAGSAPPCSAAWPRGSGVVVHAARVGRALRPGLAAFGLSPERLILARCDDDRQVLWTMEEALRCPAVGGVLGEVGAINLTAGRRLQLAAEAGGVTGLLILPPAARPTGAATSRWRVRAAASSPAPWGGLGEARWQVTLERCRGGVQRSWLLEWRHDGGGLAVVGSLDDGRLQAC